MYFSAFKFYVSINFHNNLVWWNDYLTSVLYCKDGSELGKEAISFPSLFVGIPFFCLIKYVFMSVLFVRSEAVL